MTAICHLKLTRDWLDLQSDNANHFSLAHVNRYIYIWRQLEGLGLVMCFTRWCTMGGDAWTMKNGILLLVLLQQEYTSVLLPETTKNCRSLCWDNHNRHALCYIVTDWAYTSHHLTLYMSRENFQTNCTRKLLCFGSHKNCPGSVAKITCGLWTLFRVQEGPFITT
jgi:hypothetical protein